jgi:hypothetical protein
MKRMLIGLSVLTVLFLLSSCALEGSVNVEDLSDEELDVIIEAGSGDDEALAGEAIHRSAISAELVAKAAQERIGRLKRANSKLHPDFLWVPLPVIEQAQGEVLLVELNEEGEIVGVVADERGLVLGEELDEQGQLPGLSVQSDQQIRVR